MDVTFLWVICNYESVVMRQWYEQWKDINRKGKENVIGIIYRDSYTEADYAKRNINYTDPQFPRGKYFPMFSTKSEDSAGTRSSQPPILLGLSFSLASAGCVPAHLPGWVTVTTQLAWVFTPTWNG